MRNYIITEQEKEIIRHYLANGIRLEGYGVFKNRVFKALPEILKDIITIVEFYRAIDRDAPPQTREEILKLREEILKFCEWLKEHFLEDEN